MDSQVRASSKALDHRSGAGGGKPKVCSRKGTWPGSWFRSAASIRSFEESGIRSSLGVRQIETCPTPDVRIVVHSAQRGKPPADRGGACHPVSHHQPGHWVSVRGRPSATACRRGGHPRRSGEIAGLAGTACRVHRHAPGRNDRRSPGETERPARVKDPGAPAREVLWGRYGRWCAGAKRIGCVLHQHTMVVDSRHPPIG